MSEGRILIVDDEPQIRLALQRSLEAHGFIVTAVESGIEALDMIPTWNPQVVVLDLMMPGVDGFDVLRQTREWSDVPVIVLSARGQEQDKVLALNMGADDYITKPFGVSELLARINAILRRTRGIQDGKQLESGHVHIDIAQRLVTVRDTELHLTPREYDLLVVLASHPGKVLTHRFLLETVWGGYAAENARQLRVYINYLRKKIELNPASPEIILTEPGVGYRFRD